MIHAPCLAEETYFKLLNEALRQKMHQELQEYADKDVSETVEVRIAVVPQVLTEKD